MPATSRPITATHSWRLYLSAAARNRCVRRSVFHRMDRSDWRLAARRSRVRPATTSRRTPIPGLVATIWVLALASACQPSADTPPGSPGPASPDLSPVAEGSIPRCEALPRISAPADWYRDSPSYSLVYNEQPAEEIRAWAAGKPGFEEIWIDRDHLGWITVAFSVDAAARQAELEEQFPDVGVVAVEVDWTMAELEELQRRVGQEIAPRSLAIYPMQGVVGIGVGGLAPERIAALTAVIEERFGSKPVCIDDEDPVEAPAEGP